jgi:UDP-2,4-diacetamido-2,4,6-trideoxy-beta-L-altropyranose hydrolase
MTRPAIVFRADASHAVGFGHVARLCALIEEVAAAGAEPIVMFDGDHALAAWIDHHGLTAQIRPWTPADVLAAAADHRFRAIVIDGPALAAALTPTLADRSIRTVVIDDRGDCALPVDTIVNHNFHAPALALTYPTARVRLLGRSYLMLRRAIRRHDRGACRPRQNARLRILITFGGSDPVGATARALRLIPTERPCDLIVIAGPGFRDFEGLQRGVAAATAARHTVEIVRDPHDPASLFVSADAAICAAGGTLGELAYLGCPAAAFAIVPDQIAGAQAQAQARLIAGGQVWSYADDDTLRGELGRFVIDDDRRRELRQRALVTADADGARRIVAEVLG